MKKVNVSNNEDFITGYNQALEDIDLIITEFQVAHNKKLKNYLEVMKEAPGNFTNPESLDEICKEQSVLIALSTLQRIMIGKRSNLFKELDNEED